MYTRYGIAKIMEYLNSKYDGKLEYIETVEHYTKQWGKLFLVYFKKNGVIHREQIEQSHFMDIILELKEV